MPTSTGGGVWGTVTYRVESPTFGNRVYSSMSLELASTVTTVRSGGDSGSETTVVGPHHLSPMTLTRLAAKDSKDVFKLYYAPPTKGLGDLVVHLENSLGKTVMQILLKRARLARYAHYDEGKQLIEEISIVYDDISIT